jgi:hypothetical protein
MVEFSISEPMFPFKKIKEKQYLNDLMNDKTVITGKEMIHDFKEQEKQQKEFEASIDDKLRNRRRD